MKSTEPKPRADGRRQLLVYLDPELILTLKRQALDENTHLYLLIERILKNDARSVDTTKTER